MARRITSYATYTPTAVADTVAYTTLLYGGTWLGTSSTQYTRFWEISISGQALSSSSPTYMLFSRDSTLAVTSGSAPATYQDVNMDVSSAALASPVATNVVWTTYPARSATGHLMNCSLNAFGGVFFWRANRAEECPSIIGNSVALFGLASLSAFTGSTSGAVGSHVIYETS